jgi:hypothetical protein
MRCTVQSMHASMKCFQNALAYFASAVSYVYKMFVKLTAGVNLINILPE